MLRMILSLAALVIIPIITGAATPSDGFDFPLGPPNGSGYKVFGGDNGLRFVEQDDYQNDGFPEYHPGEDWNDDNTGLDYGEDSNDMGDPVYAPSNGVIRYAQFYKPSWGHIVLIEHAAPQNATFRLPDRLETASTVWSQFGHMRNVATNPRTGKTWTPGDEVRRGEQIGSIGDYPNGSGKAFHLHFEIRIRNRLAQDFVYNTRHDGISLQPWPLPVINDHYVEPSAFVNLNRPVSGVPNQRPKAGFLMSFNGQSATNGQTLDVSVEEGAGARIEISIAPSSDPDGTVEGGEITVNGVPFLSFLGTPTVGIQLGGGQHQIEVVVIDNDGLASVPAAGTIVVETSNQPPEAGFLMSAGGQSAINGQILNLTVPVACNVPEDGNPDGTVEVTFSAEPPPADPPLSFDPDGTIVGYEWRFSETIVSTVPIFTGALGCGDHLVTLTVIDNRGGSRTAEGVVSVVGPVGQPENLSNSSGDARTPFVHVDVFGTVHTVWWEYDNPVTTGRVLYTRSFDGGTTFDPPAAVSGNLNVSFAQGRAVLASDGQNNVYVAWPLINQGVVVASSRDGGMTFDAPVLVPGKTEYTFLSTSPTIGAKTNGQLFVAWRGFHQTSNRLKILFSRSEDFGKTYSEPMVLTEDIATTGDPVMALDTVGRIYVGCFGPVVLQSSDEGFSFMALSFPLTGLVGVHDIALAADWVGKIHLATHAYTNSSDGGVTFSPRTFIELRSDFSYSHPRLAVSPDGQSIFWAIVGIAGDDNADVYTAISADGGGNWGPLTNISNNSGESGNFNSGRGGVGVAPLLSGGALVVWDDNSNGNFDIFIQKIDSIPIPQL